MYLHIHYLYSPVWPRMVAGQLGIMGPAPRWGGEPMWHLWDLAKIENLIYPCSIKRVLKLTDTTGQPPRPGLAPTTVYQRSETILIIIYKQTGFPLVYKLIRDVHGVFPGNYPESPDLEAITRLNRLAPPPLGNLARGVRHSSKSRTAFSKSKSKSNAKSTKSNA